MKKLYKILYLIVMPAMLAVIDIGLYLGTIDVSTDIPTFTLIVVIFHIAAIIAFIQAYKMDIDIIPTVNFEFVKGIGFYICYDDGLMIVLPFVAIRFKSKKENLRSMKMKSKKNFWFTFVVASVLIALSSIMYIDASMSISVDQLQIAYVFMFLGFAGILTGALFLNNELMNKKYSNR